MDAKKGIRAVAVVLWIFALLDLVGVLIAFSNPEILAGATVGQAAISLLLSFVLFLVAGFGLYSYKRWGRNLTIVLLVLSCLSLLLNVAVDTINTSLSGTGTNRWWVLVDLGALIITAFVLWFIWLQKDIAAFFAKQRRRKT